MSHAHLCYGRRRKGKSESAEKLPFSAGSSVVNSASTALEAAARLNGFQNESWVKKLKVPMEVKLHYRDQKEIQLFESNLKL